MHLEEFKTTWKSLKGRALSSVTEKKNYGLEGLIKHHTNSASGAMVAVVFLTFSILQFGFNANSSIWEMGIAILFVGVMLVRFIQERGFKKSLLKLDTVADPKNWLTHWKTYYVKRKELNKKLLVFSPILLLGIWSMILNLAIHLEAPISYRISLIGVSSALIAVAYVYFRRSLKEEGQMHQNMENHYASLTSQLDH